MKKKKNKESFSLTDLKDMLEGESEILKLDFSHTEYGEKARLLYKHYSKILRILSPIVNKRLELECICNTCNLKFVLWDNIFPTETGSGCHISSFTCPNCDQNDLDFDILCRENLKWR